MAIKLRGFGKQRNFVVAAVSVALLILIFTTGFLVFHGVHYFETPQQAPSSTRDALKPTTQSQRAIEPAANGIRAVSVSPPTPKRTRRMKAEKAMRAVSQVSARGRRFLIATAGTYAYREHVSNLACSLMPSRHKLLLVALDSRIYSTDNILPGNVRRLLLSRGTAYGKKSEGFSSLSRFGTRGFNSLTRRKLSAAVEILSAGYDLLFVDGDAVFCNPKRGISELSAQDTRSDIFAQRAAIRNQWINTGLYYARSTRATIALFKAAERFHLPQDDQAIMNKLACEPRFGGEKLYKGGKFYGCRWDKRTTISFLPTEKFPLGCTTIEGRRVNSHSAGNIRRLCTTGRVALVHYSCFSTAHKKVAMRKHGMWLSRGKNGNQCARMDWMRRDR